MEMSRIRAKSEYSLFNYIIHRIRYTFAAMIVVCFLYGCFHYCYSIWKQQECAYCAKCKLNAGTRRASYSQNLCMHVFPTHWCVIQSMRVSGVCILYSSYCLPFSWWNKYLGKAKRFQFKILVLRLSWRSILERTTFSKNLGWFIKFKAHEMSLPTKWLANIYFKFKRTRWKKKTDCAQWSTKLKRR